MNYFYVFMNNIIHRREQDNMMMPDRWEKLMDYLKQKEFTTVQELMDVFNISKSTLRRDLMAMELKNLVKRTRGGVELVNGKTNGNRNLNAVLEENKEGKMKIAQRAAAFIKDDNVIFIDSGSTCYHLINYITAKNVTVVTNGIMHIQKLMEQGIQTYILGGYANPEVNLIIGEDTEEKIGMMNFDISFLGTLGIDLVGGFTTTASIDGSVKKAVIKSSKQCYILADNTKFNVRRFYTYGQLAEAAVITDSKVDFNNDKLKIIYAEDIE